MRELKTPCFVIRTQQLDCLVESCKSEFHKIWPEGIVGYSFKTNNLPWIIKYLKEKGLWAEVVSSDEYQLAKALGYKSDNIIFNGPVKGKNEFIEAVEEGAIVNIDSKRELEWLLECNIDKISKSKIGLRVNFCLEDFCPGESQEGEEDGRFGFSYEKHELKKAIEFLAYHNIPLSGIHLHCSSKTRSINVYKAIASIADQIVRDYKLNLSYIDIGGGFFGGVAGKPTFKEYFNEVNNIFLSNPLLKNINVVIEPGMSLIGASVDYLTTVVDTKITKNNFFVLLDGSRVHIDPLMRKKCYTFHIEREKSFVGTKNVHQILCGFTCMEGDRFFELNEQALEVGDRVIFEKVGAYTMGLSPQFIEFYPPVYAEKNGQIILARKKNTADKFIGE